jgi:hypothetical protein
LFSHDTVYQLSKTLDLLVPPDSQATGHCENLAIALGSRRYFHEFASIYFIMAPPPRNNVLMAVGAVVAIGVALLIWSRGSGKDDKKDDTTKGDASESVSRGLPLATSSSSSPAKTNGEIPSQNSRRRGNKNKKNGASSPNPSPQKPSTPAIVDASAKPADKAAATPKSSTEKKQSQPLANLAAFAPTGDPPSTETESKMADTVPVAPVGGKLGGGATRRRRFRGRGKNKASGGAANDAASAAVKEIQQFKKLNNSKSSGTKNKNGGANKPGTSAN